MSAASKMSIREFFRDNALQMLTLVGVVAVLYLNQNYVRREEYTRDRDAASTELRTIQRTLDAVSTSIALLQATDHRRMLDDHETRLRGLERTVPNFKGPGWSPTSGDAH